MPLSLESSNRTASHAELTRAGEAALYLGRREEFELVLEALAEFWAESGRADLAAEIASYATAVSSESRN